MHDFLRDRILRRLEPLSDERLYQVLDYIEFLESKYAEHKAAPPNVFQRFAEGVEDTMRAGRLSATAVADTMNLMSKAMGVLNGVAAAGKSVASDLVSTATTAATAAATAAAPPKIAPPPAPPAAAAAVATAAIAADVVDEAQGRRPQ
jgi:hypothetical protein